jgi:hypothetical protein
LVAAAAVLCVGAAAQSGRVVPTPTPTPEAAPAGKEPEPPLVHDPHSPRYRLVFAEVADGPPPASDELSRHERFNGFIGRLNEAGAQGYRLLSVVNAWIPVAVVGRARERYEYGWFETDGGFWFASGDSPAVFARQARGGFRLAERFFISLHCTPLFPDEPVMGETCDLTELYLLEREKGVEQPREFYLATSSPGWRSRMAKELTAQVNEHLGKGLYPTHAFSRFQVLLEESRAEVRPEVQVVTLSTWGKGSLPKKVNELARQGWRLAVVGHKVAVMHRDAGDATPASYVWVKAKGKKFEKELARLQEAGAAYRTTYPDGDGKENQLIFEQPTVGGRRREFRVLRLDVQAQPDAGKKKESGRRSLSPEAVKLFDQLVRHEYEFRDLFYSDGVYALLERPH